MEPNSAELAINGEALRVQFTCRRAFGKEWGHFGSTKIKWLSGW